MQYIFRFVFFTLVVFSVLGCATIDDHNSKHLEVDENRITILSGSQDASFFRLVFDRSSGERYVQLIRRSRETMDSDWYEYSTIVSYDDLHRLLDGDVVQKLVYSLSEKSRRAVVSRNDDRQDIAFHTLNRQTDENGSVVLVDDGGKTFFSISFIKEKFDLL